MRGYHVCTWGVCPSEIYLPSGAAPPRLRLIKLTRGGGGGGDGGGVELIKITSFVIEADREDTQAVPLMLPPRQKRHLHVFYI